jgi:NodT family efflux transporter outer membrane factor (OMF) lipoprotein
VADTARLFLIVQDRCLPKDLMRAVTFLLVLPLVACGLASDVPPPAPEVPAAYRATAAAEVWPAAGWWRGFGSAELDGLIEAARAGNFDMRAALARVRQADAQLAASGAALLPTMSMGGSEQWSQSSSRRVTGTVARIATVESRSFSLTPSVSWELDFWGRVRAGREASTATALASRFDQEVVALTVVTSVASTWFQALALQDRVAVAGRNLADAEAILRAIQAREAAGTASALDVAQQAALVAGVRANIPGLRSQLEQQVTALGLLLGRPPSAITVRPGTLDALKLPEIAPGLPSALLARRPDVAEAEAQLAAASANIRVARAAFFPRVALSGSAGWQSLALGTLFGPGSLFANVALSGTQAVFDNGTLSAQVALNRGRYDELLANYQKTVVQAFTDVENGVRAYAFATEQERLTIEAVRVAQFAADIASEQVRAGTSDVVRALQAQTTLFQDLDSLTQVRLARFQALLSLYKAMGGGWSRDDVAAPEVRLFQGVL